MWVAAVALSCLICPRRCYKDFIDRRAACQGADDSLSVIVFDSAVVPANVLTHQPLLSTRHVPTMPGGGTDFLVALTAAGSAVRTTDTEESPVLVFMSDGAGGNASAEARALVAMRPDLKLVVIGFGGGADTANLQLIADAQPGGGKVLACKDKFELGDVFSDIADKTEAAAGLVAEFCERLSEVLSQQLALDYL